MKSFAFTFNTKKQHFLFKKGIASLKRRLFDPDSYDQRERSTDLLFTWNLRNILFF